jgi:hypothetical protein
LNGWYCHPGERSWNSELACGRGCGLWGRSHGAGRLRSFARTHPDFRQLHRGFHQPRRPADLAHALAPPTLAPRLASNSRKTQPDARETTSSGECRPTCGPAGPAGSAGAASRSSMGVTLMRINDNARSAEALHRKLRAIAAVLLDPAATEHERANAEALKLRLEKQLLPEATPTWTDIMFRLGRAVKQIKQSQSPSSAKGDWTDHAFRLGRTLRRGFKKW